MKSSMVPTVYFQEQSIFYGAESTLVKRNTVSLYLSEWIQMMSFICHIHNYTEYNEEWNVFSAFNPSKCTHLEQWAADCAAPGEQSWTSCRSRDSNPQPWVTSGFKSNALSIRPTTAQNWATDSIVSSLKWVYKPLKGIVQPKSYLLILVLFQTCITLLYGT